MTINKCSICSSGTELTEATFTVAKPDIVYVVRDVPALECTQCGHVSYDQEVVKRLERLTSGRVISARQILTAYVYGFDDAIQEIPVTPAVTQTENSTILPPIGSAVPALW